MLARTVVVLLWLIHWLPLPFLAAIGWVFGRIMWWVARTRRHITLVNLKLCFPGWDDAKRRSLAREHFGWLGRSFIERGLLWFASESRLKRLMKVEGDIGLAERHGRPTMWLMLHFTGLEVVLPTLLLNQARPVVSIYSRQSNPVIDAQVYLGRSRFGRTTLFDRRQGIRKALRAIETGSGFLNAPDMDSGIRDSSFLPFFGVPTCTLLAPARLARSLKMQVQMLVVTVLPRGRGYKVRCIDAPPGFDSDSDMLAMMAFNECLEMCVMDQPAQYWWVHRRFKTRPPGVPSVYV